MDENNVSKMICNHCKQSKALDEFTKDSRCYQGRTSPCLQCRRAERAEQAKLNFKKELCFCGKPRITDSTCCRFHRNTATKYYKKAMQNPEWVKQYRELARQRERNIKLETFEAYGGMNCACCGENHEEFLSIDHIGGRKKCSPDSPRTGGQLYRWLRRNGFPSGFRVLCMNCNWSIGLLGFCPHKKEQEILC